MPDWNIDLFACKNYIGSVFIRRDIFLEDLFSSVVPPRSFLTSFPMVLRKMESGYRLGKDKPKSAISHLLFKDDFRPRFTCCKDIELN